jgi:hypothetical protein
MCLHIILETWLFQSRAGVKCWNLSILLTICQYILV